MIKATLFKLIDSENYNEAYRILNELDKSNLIIGGQITFKHKGYNIINKNGYFWLCNIEGQIIDYDEIEDNMIEILYNIVD
jgi:hypothetical protein